MKKYLKALKLHVYTSNLTNKKIKNMIGNIDINVSNCCVQKIFNKIINTMSKHLEKLNHTVVVDCVLDDPQDKQKYTNKIMSNITTSNSAVTLIALIITIIILLILASVTLNMLMGENGIIKKAQIAKEKAEISEEIEKNNINEVENYLNSYNATNSREHESTIIETTTPINSGNWYKILDMPSGYNMENLWIVSMKLYYNDDEKYMLLPYYYNSSTFACTEIRNDGIYMIVGSYLQNKPLKIVMQKFDN